ncbi:MAG: hypothetical protein ACU0BS_07525 [Hasllibacter sp.]
MTGPAPIDRAAALGRLGAELDRAVAELQRMEDALRGSRPVMALQQVDRTIQELQAIAAICRVLERSDDPVDPATLDALKPRALIGRLRGVPPDDRRPGDLELL